jgi:putative addiction module component (TIGR02574 family)
MSTADADLSKLPLAAKLRLLEDLWDSIASSEEELPVPDWQIDELDRRKDEYLKNPQSGLSWDEVQAKVRQRHG